MMKDQNTSNKLCMLTNQKSNEVVSMKSQKVHINSELILEALATIDTDVDSIYKKINNASKINQKLYNMIHGDADFDARHSEIEDIVYGFKERINALHPAEKMTVEEFRPIWQEMQEEESQNPYGAGSANAADYMDECEEDINIDMEDAE